MKKHIQIIVVLIALIAVMTFPLILAMTTNIPAFFSSDEPYACLWESWRINSAFFKHLPIRHTFLIAHPFVYDVYGSGYISYFWFAWFYLLSVFTTPVLTYNIQIIFNFLLAGLFTYLLIFYLTKSRIVAFLGSVVFAFCPYQLVRTWQHLSLTYNQWIPFSLLGAIILKENPSRRNLIFFSITILTLLSFDYTIMFLTALVLTAWIIYVLFYNWRQKFFSARILNKDLKYFKKIITAGILVVFILLPQFFPIIKNRFYFSGTTQASAHNGYRRPFGDLFRQSAKLLSYFLPATTHPFLGKFTENFVGTKFYGESVTEHTLYLGWTPLVLAFVAARRWRKTRKQPSAISCQSSERDKENFYIGFFIFLAIVAWLFSQPPWWKIGALKIYMPSFFMYKILPMYRAYCRFGIVVMLAVAVLAGFGLKFVLERFKSQKVKIALAALFCVLVLFEFWNYPPFKVIDVSKVPEVYYWLKRQPGDFAIAEYPLDADSPSELYKFFQTAHEKKIINGTIPGTYPNKVAQTIRKLSKPDTTGVLKWMGVKYAVVHTEKYLKTELIEEKEELESIPKNTGLKFIASFPAQECPDKNIMCVQKTGPIDVYEVTALPREPITPPFREN